MIQRSGIMPQSQSTGYEITILRFNLCAILIFLNFRASSIYSTEIRRESATSLYLLLPSNNMIKNGLVFL
jgi:hypothetical protein